MDFSEFGRHAEYVIAAYAMAALVIAVLIIWVRSDKSQLDKEMQALEASGIRRRSTRRAGPSVSQVVSSGADDKSES
ncbi:MULTISPECIES: heme exporter protein CcmD [Pseudovibrio]|jgi:heme exporter protein D|uniref:Heme exporter protein D n=1 Tax=Pseudovibrio ascidiaceicola TaxID=285279 RepID=A0A1I3V4M0_9HYPH|nr:MULTISPECIES: heme exporter protein CcmD [Pseudovibrio]KZL16645.1 Heme exporter protein D (CcmD) [Pseudovibrio sp. Ad26]KZL26140.1 Heme exporter protein D (CcmD) [Pseudovibrio sp. WM33]KZL29492.1 Heme exporter protein D (CcmD) [Pseudovibrio sp. Ad37]SFJ90428.1 heme exporter protein D [Pseudovibrio ascidiaceicola]